MKRYQLPIDRQKKDQEEGLRRQRLQLLREGAAELAAKAKADERAGKLNSAKSKAAAKHSQEVLQEVDAAIARPRSNEPNPAATYLKNEMQKLSDKLARNPYARYIRKEMGQQDLLAMLPPFRVGTGSIGDWEPRAQASRAPGGTNLGGSWGAEQTKRTVSYPQINRFAPGAAEQMANDLQNLIDSPIFDTERYSGRGEEILSNMQIGPTINMSEETEHVLDQIGNEWIVRPIAHADMMNRAFYARLFDNRDQPYLHTDNIKEIYNAVINGETDPLTGFLDIDYYRQELGTKAVLLPFLTLWDSLFDNMNNGTVQRLMDEYDITEEQAEEIIYLRLFDLGINDYYQESKALFAEDSAELSEWVKLIDEAVEETRPIGIKYLDPVIAGADAGGEQVKEILPEGKSGVQMWPSVYRNALAGVLLSIIDGGLSKKGGQVVGDMAEGFAGDIMGEIAEFCIENGFDFLSDEALELLDELLTEETEDDQ